MNYDTNLQTAAASNAHFVVGVGQQPANPLTDDACIALDRANELHGYLDGLEVRLFGPEPRGVEQGSTVAEAAKPSILSAVKATRQRLESAGGRLERILSRL